MQQNVSMKRMIGNLLASRNPKMQVKKPQAIHLNFLMKTCKITKDDSIKLSLTPQKTSQTASQYFEMAFV